MGRRPRRTVLLVAGLAAAGSLAVAVLASRRRGKELTDVATDGPTTPSGAPNRAGAAPARGPEAEPGPDAAGVHLPAPSIWPLVLAGGLTLMALGILTHPVFLAVGAVLTVLALVGWTREVSRA